MKVFQNIKERNIAYDKIFRSIYKCKMINEKFFNIITGISEDEFIKKCFEPSKIVPEQFIKMIDTEIINVNQLQYMGKNSTVKMWLMIKTDKLLNDTYKNDMLSLFSDIFFIIEEIDTDENFLINLFMNLDLFSDYKDIFYIFSLLQISECELNSEAIKVKDADEYFFNPLSSILKFIMVEQLIKIIGEDRIKWYFLLLFDSIIDDVELNEMIRNDPEFFFFLKTFNTYKWLDKKRKEKLDILAKNEAIFYKEHAEYMKRLGKNEYMGEMMLAMMEYNDCLVF